LKYFTVQEGQSLPYCVGDVVEAKTYPVFLPVCQFLHIAEYVGACVDPLDLEVGQLWPLSLADDLDAFVSDWISGDIQMTKKLKFLTCKDHGPFVADLTLKNDQILQIFIVVSKNPS